MNKELEALERLSQIKNFFNEKKMREPENPFNDKWEKNIFIIEQTLKGIEAIPIKLNSLLNVMHSNCKFMIYSDNDKDHIIFGGFKEDLYKEILLEYGNYEVKEIRTIFKDLWIKIGE